jgi:rhodanese-related sulfurtransferase
VWGRGRQMPGVQGLNSIIRAFAHSQARPLKFFIDNWYLFLAAAVSGGLLVWPLIGRGTGGGKLSTAEAVQLINRERAVLIDVSEPAEYAAGHVAGAKNVPLGKLEASGDLPKNKTLPVIVVCATGMRATRAVATLKKLGHEKSHALAGGLAAWREASLPVEKATDAAAGKSAA